MIFNGVKMSSFLFSLVILLISVTVLTATKRTLRVTESDCSKLYALPLNYSSTTVEVIPSQINFLRDGCNITFYTEDRSGYIALKFGDDEDNFPYINDPGVSISVCTNHVSEGSKQVKTYTYLNEMMQDETDQQFETNSISVVLNGHGNLDWQLFFQIHAIDGPISGYPFSIAGGVFALTVASTVVVILLFIGCCYCCCCRTTESKQRRQRARRRTKIINQLRKEGYSVTRDYGATSDTTPILDGAYDSLVNPTTHEREFYDQHPQRRRLNHEPPPSYDCVSGVRSPMPPPSAPDATLPCADQLSHQTPLRSSPPSRPVYNVSYSINPQPTVSIVNGTVMPKPPSPPAPDLIDFETDISEVQQPTRHRPTEVLPHFETPPEEASVNVDLLCNDGAAADDVVSIPPPAYGEVR